MVGRKTQSLEQTEPAERARTEGRKDFRRHLEGWQVGAVAVGMVVLSAALVTPRDVGPMTLPLPRIDRLEQRRALERMQRLAAQAETERLPYDVRAVGELVRRVGAARAERRLDDAEHWHSSLLEIARAARAEHGDELLLRLRAIQTRLFLRALARWQASGRPDAELIELGGRFLEQAGKNRWLGSEHRLNVAADDLAMVYRMRWSVLTGLAAERPFAPTLNDHRAHFRLLLEHGPPGSEPGAVAIQLDRIAALAERDPDYPEELARGVIAYQTYQFPRAVVLFRAHMAKHPHGPWRLRAQNYLFAALNRAGQTP